MEKKIDERTFEFALEIVDLYKYMIENKEYVLSKQVLRSGTSIGANVQESQAAQSKADFISKMSIASKEAREANYWLRLLKDAEIYDDKKLIDISEELIKILTSIVKTGNEKSTKN